MRSFISFLFLLLLAFPPALAAGETDSFKGVAVLRVRSKRIPETVIQQAVIVRGDEARFVGLTDFGDVAFEVSLSEQGLAIVSPRGTVRNKTGKIKRLLSLPLTRDEFLSIVKYRLPPGFSREADGDGERWRKKGEAKLDIRLAGFRAGASPRFPTNVRIAFKKNLFELAWQRVEFGGF